MGKLMSYMAVGEHTVLYDLHTAIPLCFHSAVDLSFNGLSFIFSLPESLESATRTPFSSSTIYCYSNGQVDVLYGSG